MKKIQVTVRYILNKPRGYTALDGLSLNTIMSVKTDTITMPQQDYFTDKKNLDYYHVSQALIEQKNVTNQFIILETQANRKIKVFKKLSKKELHKKKNIFKRIFN